MELLTRDYGKVQKGKGICDRVCGMAKAQMRSWVAAGNDVKNAIDIEEGMEYAGGIKNTKVAVAEVFQTQVYSPFLQRILFWNFISKVISTKQMWQMFPCCAQFSTGLMM